MGRPARESGVLLHVTSLPSGRLGDDARAFVDWLRDAGQRWWQILPVTPPDEHHSPYRSMSAFAGWEGLLEDPQAPVTGRERDAFRRRHAFWIEGWERFAGGDAVDDQVRFAREWDALRAYARERGVRIMGDLPIFVAWGGADHREHPELFNDALVTGCPPDAFTADGQLWGNPVYDWPALWRRGYRWWVERFRRTMQLHDMVRVDHFRGFVAGWGVPAGDATARGGRWRRGPGQALFDAVAREVPDLALVAENLGVITPPVEALRRHLGLPGMAVLQFAFDGRPDNEHHPDHITEDTVAYPGTHDNQTVQGWWSDASGDQRAAVVAAARARDITDPEPWWMFTRLALESPARLAVIAAQDIIGLGDEARMNSPGTEDGNWTWRMPRRSLGDRHAERLLAATARAGRA